MIDNGSAVSLVKRSVLDPELLVDPNNSIPLSGIGQGGVRSLGTVVLTIRNVPTTFYVVQDDFPIEEDGMIGRGFLKQEEAVISYHNNALMISGDVMNPIPFVRSDELAPEKATPNVYTTNAREDRSDAAELDEAIATLANESLHLNRPQSPLPPQEQETPVQAPSENPGKVRITVPGRTKTVVRINLIKTGLEEGYLPPVSINKHIILGKGIVTNEDNTCKVLAINSNEDDVTFDVDPQEILPFDYLRPDLDFESDTGAEEEPPRTSITDPAERVKLLKETIKTDHLSEALRARVFKYLEENHDRFYLPGDYLPCTNKVYHRIPTTNEMPANAKQYRYPPAHKDFFNKQIAKDLRNGVIKPSESPSNSPVWIVPKRPDKDGKPRWRLVIDFRDLNSRTVGDAYPLPNITDILDQLAHAVYFSVFGLAMGFKQIPMHPDDAWKTGF